MPAKTGVFLLSCIIAFLAASGPSMQARTPAMVEFAMRQLWPEVRLQMESFIWEGPSAVAMQKITLIERKSGIPLATVGAAKIRWSYGDLLRRKVEEISLDDLSIEINSRLFSVLPQGKKQEEATQDVGQAGGGWSIGRLHCRYGQLIVEDPEIAPIAVRTLFTFDWSGFGTTSALAQKMHKLVLWNVQAGPAPGGLPVVASINLVEAEVSPSGLFRNRRVEQIVATGGVIRAGAELRQILQEHSQQSAKPQPAISIAATAPTPPWILETFRMENVRVEVSGGFPGVGPGFAFTLNTSFTDVPLGALPLELGGDVQQVELAQIEILSPIDPMVRVLSIHSVFVYFSLEGILSSKIQRVVLLNPTIYLSQDLFFYMQEMRASEQNQDAESSPPADAASSAADPMQEDSGWIIEQLRIEFGRLVLGGERMGEVGLPMSFKTSAANVRFDDLASLRLETTLQVEPQSFAFPELQLDLERLRGELRFAYPPTQSPDNLVNELYLDGLRWRQFEGRDLWLAATFDSTGVFATFGGKAYGGYMNAGLSFFFGGDSRWIGWVTGTAIDLAQLTAVLAPKNVTMTGVADVRVEVDASGSKIDRVRGGVFAPKSGALTITKLDEFIDDLPEEWSELKRSGATIALETLRDFRYDQLNAEFWFVENQGRFDLKLPGPRGSRNFSLFLHADATTDGTWKLGIND